MDLQKRNDPELVLPQGWDESEQYFIDMFFRNAQSVIASDKNGSPDDEEPLSALACRKYAQSLMRGKIIALINCQGCASYTLQCPEEHQITRFRLKKLDTAVLDEAKKIFGSLVFPMTYHDGFNLPVYTCDIVPGHPRYYIRTDDEVFPLEREMRTVADLAKVFATPSKFPHPDSRYQGSSWTVSASTTLKRLEQNTALEQLAPEVHTEVVGLATKLHLLQALPPVLTHVDIAHQNMFVEEATGAVTGIIDFDEARTEVFGISLYSLYESFFGDTEHTHWKSYDALAGTRYPGKLVCQVLEDTFWRVFWENVAPGLTRENIQDALNVSLKLGIMYRYLRGTMIDTIDTANAGHVRSLDYAQGILS